MSSHEKLLERFLSRPKDFTYRELKRLLSGLGFKEDIKGKTSGSRVEWINHEVDSAIELHKPHHSGDALRPKTLKEIEDKLGNEGFI